MLFPISGQYSLTVESTRSETGVSFYHLEQFLLSLFYSKNKHIGVHSSHIITFGSNMILHVSLACYYVILVFFMIPVRIGTFSKIQYFGTFPPSPQVIDLAASLYKQQKYLTLLNIFQVEPALWGS